MKNEKVITLYNPLPYDFSVKYDLHGRGIKTYTIRARDIGRFIEPVAEHIIIHLVDQIFEERGYIKGHGGNTEASKKAYKKEVVTDV